MSDFLLFFLVWICHWVNTWGTLDNEVLLFLLQFLLPNNFVRSLSLNDDLVPLHILGWTRNLLDSAGGRKGFDVVKLLFFADWNAHLNPVKNFLLGKYFRLQLVFFNNCLLQHHFFIKRRFWVHVTFRSALVLLLNKHEVWEFLRWLLFGRGCVG